MSTQRRSLCPDITPSERSLWARGLVLVILVVFASWPWHGLREGFAKVFCGFMEPLLEATTFEGQTNITMIPLAPKGESETRTNRSSSGPRTTQTRQENIVADTALVLRLSKYAGQMQVQVSLRRDVYLPLVIYAALVVIAPLSWRRKLVTLGVGSSVIVLVGVVAVYVLLANIFSGRLMLAPQLAAVYPVSETWGDVLQFLHERWLTPPGNRVIGPLLLAVAALALQVDELRLNVRKPATNPARQGGVNSLASNT